METRFQLMAVCMCACLMILLTNNARASGQFIFLPQTSFDYDITARSEVFEDTTQSLNIDDILKLQGGILFSQIGDSRFSKAHNASSYWIRFYISNHNNNVRTAILSMADTSMRGVELYRVDANTLRQQKIADQLVHIHGLYNQANAFQINLEPKQHAVFYLRITSNNSFSTNFNLLSYDIFLHNEHKGSIYTTFVLTLSLVFMVLFLHSYVRRKNAFTLLCAIYSISAIAMMFFWMGASNIVLDIRPQTNAFAMRVALALSSVIITCLPLCLSWQNNQKKWVHLIVYALLLVQLTPVLLSIWLLPKHLLLIMTACSIINTTSLPCIFWIFTSRRQRAQTWIGTGVSILGIVGLLSFFSSQELVFVANFSNYAVTLLPLVMMICMLFADQDIIRSSEPNQRTSLTLGHNALWLQLARELYSPISSILGVTNVLIRSPLSDTQRQYVRTLERATDKLHLTSKRMANASQVASKSFHLQPHPINTQEHLNTCIRDVQHSASERGIEITTDVSDIRNTLHTLDSERFDLLISAILEKMIHNSEQGQLHIRASHYDIHQKTGLMIRLHSQANLLKSDALLTHINTLKTSMRPKPAKQDWEVELLHTILKSMNASINTHTPSDTELSITLYLPSDTEFNVFPAASSPEEAALIGVRSLVVSENTELRDTLRYMMKSWGMRVEKTYKTQGAMAMLRHQTSIQKPYQIVVLDHTNEDSDGFALIERVLQDPDVEHALQIIWLTNEPEALTHQQARCITVLPKPITYSTLQHVLIKQIGR